jgi:hypothetical protein
MSVTLAYISILPKTRSRVHVSLSVDGSGGSLAYDNFYKVLNCKNSIALPSLYLGYDYLSYVETDC